MKKGYLLGEYRRGEIHFPYEIKKADVGKMLDQYFGDVQPSDAGKMLVMQNGVLQMENDEQLKERRKIMTGKHFKALAEALKYERPNPSWSNKFLQWEADCKAVMSVCRQFNGNFDTEKFKLTVGLIN